MKKSMALLLISLGSVSAVKAATTFDELKAEIAAAKDGDTVYIENDFDYTGGISIAKSLTIRSREGRRFCLTRAAENASGRLFALNSGSSNSYPHFVLRDVVIDGNKAEGQPENELMFVQCGLVEFESGCAIENYSRSADSRGTIVIRSNGWVRLCPGATVRRCENRKGASAILIGATGSGSTDGTFEMCGGEIVDNADHYPSAANEGGAIYLLGGTFLFKGGTISRNVSDNGVGGVMANTGKFQICGTGSIVDNTGGSVDDVYVGQNAPMQVIGDYTGWMTIDANFNPSAGGACGRVEAVGGASFKMQNVRYQKNLRLALDGTSLYSGKYPYWRTIVALTGKTTVRSFGDIAACIPADEAETVTLLEDWPVTWPLLVSEDRDVTFTSGPGGPYSIYSKDGQALFRVNGATLRLRDVVLDGHADQDVRLDGTYRSLLWLEQDGKLSLDRGAVIRNAANSSNTVGINILYEGAVCEMNDGALICGLTATSDGAHASAVRVGAGGPYVANPPAFVMNGGVISNCICKTTSGNPEICTGGTVLVNGGVCKLYGGLITENAAEGSPSGVLVYKGSAEIEGDPVVCGNVGKYPDLFICHENQADYRPVTMTGDFRGRIGVSSGGQRVDGNLFIDCAQGATGAWNFFGAGSTVIDQDLIGYMWAENRRVYLGKADGFVDGVGYVSAYEDVSCLLPREITISSETLPYKATTLCGAARALSGSVKINLVGAEGLKAVDEIRLIEGLDGELSGTWTFETPQVSSGKWKVRRQATELGSAYVLKWRADGMSILVR